MEENNLRTVTLYTDGACSGNPGPGGWGCVLEYKGKTRELSGYMAGTTNNRMELLAVISGLGALKEPCIVNVYSDSAYVVNAFNKGWIQKWQANGWVNSSKEPVENQDMWKLLLLTIRCKKLDVHFHKVEGHADDEMNNLCDKLATDAIKEYHRINSEAVADY